MKRYTYAYIGVNDSGKNTILDKYDYSHLDFELHCFIDKPKLYSCKDLYKSRIIRVISGNSTLQLLSLYDIVQSSYKIYLFGGLGAKTGNTYFLKLSKTLTDKNIKFKSIVNTPFYFEGKNRNIKAQKVLKEMKLYGDVSSISLETLMRQYGRKKFRLAFHQFMLMSFKYV